MGVAPNSQIVKNLKIKSIFFLFLEERLILLCEIYMTFRIDSPCKTLLRKLKSNG